MSDLEFSEKDPAEILSLGFDFSNLLGDSETVLTTTWTSSVVSAEIADSNPLVLSLPSTNGAVVSTKVSGGTSGIVYKIRVVITTSASRTLVGCASLPVHTC